MPILRHPKGSPGAGRFKAAEAPAMADDPGPLGLAAEDMSFAKIEAAAAAMNIDTDGLDEAAIARAVGAERILRAAGRV